MEHVIAKKEISFPKYSKLPSRLETFTAASKDSFLYKSRTEFADAGFFYTGQDDKTICHYCGGGLQDWQATDNPWEEHARWFSRCPFLLVQKGREFVHDHRKIYKPHPVKTLETPTEEEDRSDGNGCAVCLSNEKNLLFLPCRHCCTCSECGLMYNNCIICRAPIRHVMKIFIS